MDSSLQLDLVMITSGNKMDSDRLNICLSHLWRKKVRNQIGRDVDCLTECVEQLSDISDLKSRAAAAGGGSRWDEVF